VLAVEQMMDTEQAYWQRLVDLGLIKTVRSQPAEEWSFEPVHVTGIPISQTIIEERR
jgi:hypothetical protein